METKEIKINIPKGYENRQGKTLHLSVSSLSLVKKNTLLIKIFVLNSLKKKVPGYYVDPNGRVQVTRAEAFITDPINAPKKK